MRLDTPTGAEVEAETLFFPDDHQPPLGHEYQFNLDTDEGRRFLERLLTFLRQRLGAKRQSQSPFGNVL